MAGWRHRHQLFRRSPSWRATTQLRRILATRARRPPIVATIRRIESMSLDLLTSNTKNTALTLVGDDDAFAAYANAVAPRNIIGTLLKFSKGDYLAGEEGAPVAAG